MKTCPDIKENILSSTFWYKFEKNYGYEENVSAEMEIADEDCDE